MKIGKNVFEILKKALEYYSINIYFVECDDESKVIDHRVSFSDVSDIYDASELKYHIMSMEKTLEIMNWVDKTGIEYSEKEAVCDINEVKEKMRIYLDDSRFADLTDLLETLDPEPRLMDKLNEDAIRAINRTLLFYSKGMMTHTETLEMLGRCVRA